MTVKTTDANGYAVFEVAGYQTGTAVLTASISGDTEQANVYVGGVDPGTGGGGGGGVITPTNGLRLSSTLLTDAVADANAAANGAKNAAYLTSIATDIGSAYKLKIRRDTTVVLEMTASGSLSTAGGVLTVATNLTKNSSAAANPGTETLVMRIEKAADANVYIEGSVGLPNSGADFILQSAIDSGTTILLSPAIVMSPPQFDTVTNQVNTVDTIINDMTLVNDCGRAWNVGSTDGWNRPPSSGVTGAFVEMGTIPSGNRASVWQRTQTEVPLLNKGPEYYQSLLPWGLLCEEATEANVLLNSAVNTRIELRGMKLWMQYRSNMQWIQVGPTGGEDIWYAAKSDQTASTTPPSIRVNTSGNNEILFPAGNSNVVHFWATKVAPQMTDINCIMVTMQARLVLDDPSGVDDRASARYVLASGCDTYWRIDSPGTWAYSVANGTMRFKRITNSWQAFNYASLTSARHEWTDVAAEDGRYGEPCISPTSFRASFPPLD